MNVVVSMNCDICGRQITGPAFKVRVEGAKMLVCAGCKHLGKPYVEEVQASARTRNPRAVRLPSAIRRAPDLPKDMQELEVDEDYSRIVLHKRMKLDLSQEELAKRVKEKLSVIQKIETGKIAPDTKLCRELEHELRITLLVPRKEATLTKTAAPAELTLGDIIRIKDKSKSDDTS